MAYPCAEPILEVWHLLHDTAPFGGSAHSFLNSGPMGYNKKAGFYALQYEIVGSVAMVIYRAKVSAKRGLRSGSVSLTLEKKADGWTYRVEEVSDEAFYLTWRTRSAEQASRKLKDVYHPSRWELTVMESRSDTELQDGNENR